MAAVRLPLANVRKIDGQDKKWMDKIRTVSLEVPPTSMPQEFSP